MSPFFKKNKQNNSNVVKSPNWASFREFWNDCDITITPMLNGFIDIEGGHIGISGRWHPQCSDCAPGGTCSNCGRNPQNYLELRAGDGDGTYSVFELWFDSVSRGALVVLDPRAAHAPTIINSIHETHENGYENVEVINQLEQDLFKYFYETMAVSEEDLDMYLYGEIQAESHPVYNAGANPTGVIVFGESGEGIDSNQCLVTVNHVKQGKYRVYIFGQRGSIMDALSATLSDSEGSENTETSGVLVPRYVLVLHQDVCEEIGLTRDFAEHLSPSMELDEWQNSLVMARIGEPLAPQVAMGNMIWFDLKFGQAIKAQQVDELTALDMKLESLSWLLLMNLMSPNEELNRIFIESSASLADYLDMMYKVRGQFNRRLET